MRSIVALRLFVAALLLLVSGASAHVSWTQANSPDPGALGIYHLDDTTLNTGASLIVAPDHGTPRSLIIQAPTGTGFSNSADVEYVFFGTSLRMDGAQRADSAKNFGYDDPAYVGMDTNGSLPGDNTNGPDQVDKDLTIELWLRWDDAPTSSSVEVGFRSGAKLRITRDTVTPSNDQLALVATHGTTVSAPSFTTWAALDPDEAPLGEWLHLAVAIDSTGSTYDSGSGHYRYNAGTVGRFYINNHAFGAFPHTVALDGLLDFHSESSLLTIRNISGVATIDEVAIWGSDLSVGGTVSGPFSNGRGAGVSGINDWQLF